MPREGIWNRYEQDRGIVSCGDCSKPMGHRIDIDPGTVALLCDPCYDARHESPPVTEEPKGVRKGGERGRGKEEGQGR